jgi:enoyl-CoA hydratase/carnithine racemase
MTYNYQRLKIERNGDIAEVVLAQPKTRNALDNTYFLEFGIAFKELDKDESVNVILLRADGNTFSAGLDLKVAAGTLLSKDEDVSPAVSNLAFMKMLLSWQKSITAIEKCKKPVIVACQGPVIGAAVDIITACDIRLCTKDAYFSIRETKVGLVADLGTLQRISPIVGKAFAREMAFTGGDFDSTRALQNHLVSNVFEDTETMLVAARKLAKNIAANSPLVVQGTKKVLQYAEKHGTDQGLDQVALWNSAFIKSDDLGEAIIAFMEKRQPKFKNKL